MKQKKICRRFAFFLGVLLPNPERIPCFSLIAVEICDLCALSDFIWFLLSNLLNVLSVVNELWSITHMGNVDLQGTPQTRFNDIPALETLS